MRSLNRFAAVTVGVLLFSSNAQAVSVTNRDDRDHKITVIEGSAKQDHVLKSDAVLDGICKGGCIIRLDDDDVNPYELQGSEVTSIEGGEIYADQAEQPASPVNGAAGQPSVPGTGP